MAWAVLVIYLHFQVFLIIMVTGHANENTTIMMEAAGDIIIGGIFPFHEDVKERTSFVPQPQPCGSLKEGGLIKALAMINAIEVMNNSSRLKALNVTLGYRILDSCSDPLTALRVTGDFMQRGNCYTESNTSACAQPVMAVIGGSSSEVSITIARQLTLQMIPQISYSSSAVILSDKKRFPAFLRTVPNDKHQTAGMVSLLHTFGWNWVGIVITDGDYGRSALDNFVSQALEIGICVSFKSILPQFVTGKEFLSAIEHTATTILNNPKVQVIVSFAKSKQMRQLFQKLKNQTLRAGQNMESMRRVWVASDNWSSSKSVTENMTLRDVGQVVGFTFVSGDGSSLGEYLNRLEAAGHNNSFLKKFYSPQHTTEGRGKDPELMSKAVKALREIMHFPTIFSTEMAVSAITETVISVCRSRDCKTPGKMQPWEMLKALQERHFELGGKTYKFDKKGDINLGYDVTMWLSDGGTINISDVVAEYHPHTNTSLHFTYTDHKATQYFQDLKNTISKCSNSCVPGEFKKTAEGQHTCCYECINCTENQYSNETDMDQCLSCDTNREWSAEGSSNCTLKEVVFFSWQNNPYAVVLLTFSALGILLAVMVSALFLHQRETPVVKAAGGPVSQVILFSLVISYISAVLFVGRPNHFQCKARQVLFGISFTLCVSCILVKTLQILLAFQFNPALQGVLRRFFKPCIIAIFCVALQVITCICWLVMKSPYHNTVLLQTTLLEECNEGSDLAFGVMLGYIALLAFVCFICAFKGRKLPEFYNEAKFITFSMLLYLISWMLFVPVYITTSGVYLSAVEMVVILISNYGIFSCHFLPKCYIIIFKKEQNTMNAFRKNVYDYTSRTSNSISISESSMSEKQSSVQDFICALSSSVPADGLLEPGVVTNCREGTSCTRLHRNPATQHSLRRSSI